MKMLCPHCGVKGTADDSYIGKMVRCPKCEAIFEVFSEGNISLPGDVQPSAALSPYEAEAQDKIGSPDKTVHAENNNHGYSSVSMEKENVDEIESEIHAETEEEDVFSVEPVEVLKWSDRASGLDQESVDADETDETAAETPLEEPENSAVDFPADKKITTPEISSSGEKKETIGGTSMLGPDVATTLRAKGFQGNDPDLIDSCTARIGFSIVGVIKDAWKETMGAKASIWAGSSVVFLMMIIGGAAGTFLMPIMGFDTLTATGMVVNVVVEALLTVISIIFTAGLLYMGVRKVAGDVISWKMVFKGFSFTGQIILAAVLQTLLIGLGLLLLVLPGIYLAVGYGLTLPLILDQKMSAWEAMETSRKAIHKVWWKVTGVLFLMGLIYTVSAIPLGIGLIWTVPMFIVLGGVVYRCLFGVKKNG